jgi:hypothetical protein
MVSKIVRDRYAISAAQMQIQNLLAEAAAPTVDILSSMEEHPTSPFKGTESSISKGTLHNGVPSKSKPFINLSKFASKSFTENDTSKPRRAAFNKGNVIITEVIKKEKPEYILPNSISYPSSEEECEKVSGSEILKRKKNTSKIKFVTPKEPVPCEQLCF